MHGCLKLSRSVVSLRLKEKAQLASLKLSKNTPKFTGTGLRGFQAAFSYFLLQQSDILLKYVTWANWEKVQENPMLKPIIRKRQVLYRSFMKINQSLNLKKSMIMCSSAHPFGLSNLFFSRFHSRCRYAKNEKKKKTLFTSADLIS